MSSAMLIPKVQQARSPRYRVRWQVRIWVGEHIENGTIHNASATGIFIETTMNAAHASLLELEMVVPNGPPLIAKGRVVRHAWPLPVHGFGIKFVEVGDSKSWLEGIETLRREDELRTSDLFEIILDE